MLQFRRMAQRLLAQLDLQEAYTLTPGGTPVAEQYSDPATLITQLLPNILVLAGVLLFFFMVGAGFKMVANSGNSKATEDGKKALGFALGGFILLMSAYWIMQIIQVLTGIQILSGTP